MSCLTDSTSSSFQTGDQWRVGGDTTELLWSLGGLDVKRLHKPLCYKCKHRKSCAHQTAALVGGLGRLESEEEV